MFSIRILIAPNSFKESAASTKIAGYFYDYLPDGFVKILKPISDGGDGFLDVCKFYFDDGVQQSQKLIIE